MLNLFEWVITVHSMKFKTHNTVAIQCPSLLVFLPLSLPG